MKGDVDELDDILESIYNNFKRDTAPPDDRGNQNYLQNFIVREAREKGFVVGGVKRKLNLKPRGWEGMAPFPPAMQNVIDKGLASFKNVQNPLFIAWRNSRTPKIIQTMTPIIKYWNSVFNAPDSRLKELASVASVVKTIHAFEINNKKLNKVLTGSSHLAAKIVPAIEDDPTEEDEGILATRIGARNTILYAPYMPNKIMLDFYKAAVRGDGPGKRALDIGLKEKLGHSRSPTTTAPDVRRVPLFNGVFYNDKDIELYNKVSDVLLDAIEDVINDTILDTRTKEKHLLYLKDYIKDMYSFIYYVNNKDKFEALCKLPETAPRRSTRTTGVQRAEMLTPIQKFCESFFTGFQFTISGLIAGGEFWNARIFNPDDLPSALRVPRAAESRAAYKGWLTEKTPILVLEELKGNLEALTTPTLDTRPDIADIAAISDAANQDLIDADLSKELIETISSAPAGLITQVSDGAYGMGSLDAYTTDEAERIVSDLKRRARSGPRGVRLAATEALTAMATLSGMSHEVPPLPPT